MFRSIRATLLFWYAAILILVVAGFGAALQVKASRSLWDELDQELRERARGVAASIEVQPDRTLRLRLPDDYVRHFRLQSDRLDAESPYFVVWNAEGAAISVSNPAQEALPVAPEHLPREAAKPRMRGREGFQEAIAIGPQGSLVVVGRSTHKIQTRLRDFLFVVLGAGAVAVAAALGGGWFLAGRVLAPIERISRDASAISATDLAKRIDLAQTENELGRLAEVLNGTFDRLQQAFERQARFTGDASHELRTPLSTITTIAELALRKPRSAQQYQESFQTVLKAARRMQSIVEDLLLLARADARELPLACDPVDFQDLVEEAVCTISPLAEEKKLRVSVQAEAVCIRGDRERLLEVLMNLLSNAIRYNHENGNVAISVKSESDQAVLEVADTGIGISEADQPHVFERFYRADKARSRAVGGSGLGLAIAKWIVEAHGGAIAVTSKEGEGSTFKVVLPKVDRDRDEPSNELQESDPGISS